VLTKEDNDRLTQVGPGTPGGELLRRFWHPIAPVQELTDDQPTRFVRLLGEDLVLYRDKSGNAGLIQDHCAHRGASLLYGRVEERGIACAYHGWLFDTAGNCLECPAEPAGSMFHLTVKIKAYPVRKFIGLYWAYLGPQPAPEIPRYDVWTRQDGRRKIIVHPQLDSNWFQAMENSADPAHVQILHQHPERGDILPNQTRGRIDTVENFDFYETPYGFMKRRFYVDGHWEEHPILFPNILRQGTTTQIRVPIDDTHTYIVFVRFFPSKDGSMVEEPDELPVEYREPYKSPGVHPEARFRVLDPTGVDNQIQDYMVLETQRPVSDRTIERLATSDRGIIMYRDIMFREIERVERGEDPLGTVRDPAHPMIDTELQSTIQHQFERPPAGARVGE
jgi:5,5'-dehydrodivanillate O-demethylase oxygenase subunit